MNTMFWIFCIVAVVFAAESYQKYLKTQHEKKQSDPELEASLAKIKTLEERIQVLERIITENKRDIGREIDNL